MLTKKLFVGNLDFRTTQDEVAALFSQVGEVTDVFLPTDRATGRPRGFAFVTFAQEEAAAKALEDLQGTELGGREVRISFAEERRRMGPPPPPGPFGGGGGGGGRGGDRGRPSRPKGSRRGMRGKKRSI